MLGYVRLKMRQLWFAVNSVFLLYSKTSISAVKFITTPYVTCTVLSLDPFESQITFLFHPYCFAHVFFTPASVV